MCRTRVTIQLRNPTATLFPQGSIHHALVPMVLDYSSNTDARHSSFNQAGRDWRQTHINNNTTIYRPIYISFSPRLITHRISNNLSDPPRFNISSPETLPPRSITCHTSDPTAIFSAAVDLIDRIIDILMGNRYSWNGLLDLALEFESLQKTSILTRVTIQKYDHTPLDHRLASVVNPQALQCCFVLQELFDSVDGTWLGLNFTRIGDLWCQVWRSRWDGDEFASSRKKLTENRQSLQGVLMALHSYIFLVLHACTETSSRSLTITKCCMDGPRE